MRKVLCLVVILCSLYLCACDNGSSNENLTPTGYPTGEIQQPQIMYNGQIYYYYATGFDEPLPNGYAHVGSVADVDNINEPEEDLHGARVTLEQEVYANETNQDSIYIKYEKGFAEFTVKQ